MPRDLIPQSLRGPFLAVHDVVVRGAAVPAAGDRVLVVRTDMVGDFVLWLDAARALTAHFRERGMAVTLVGNVAWTPWAEQLGLADEVWGLDPNRFVRDLRYRREWLRRVRRAGFSVAVQPVHSRRFMIGDALVRASGAPQRIGAAGDSANNVAWLKWWGDRWYTHLIPAIPGHAMDLVRNADFLRGLGLAGFVARVVTLPGQVHIDLPAQPYAVLFPGASWEGKRWSAASFAAIGRRLAGRGLQVVLAGGADERARADIILRGLDRAAVDRVGETSLAELTELLRHADIVVANDTSAVHIAAAVGTPVVSVTGGGHYGRFLPYQVEERDPLRPLPVVVVQPMPCFGCNWRCIHPRAEGDAVNCIRDIAVEQVWRKIDECLAGKQPR